MGLRKRLSSAELHVTRAGIGLGVFGAVFILAKLLEWRVPAEISWVGMIFFAVVGVLEGIRWLQVKRRLLRRERGSGN